MRADLASKYNKLVEILKEMQTCIVAFSGGVDSSLLLYVANKVLGKNALSITVKSPYHFSAEVKDAETFVRKISGKHETIDFKIADEIRTNPKDRCYLCKKKIFSTLVQIAKDRNINYVIEGSNTDDNKVYRPGLKALEELGVRSPLMEAGFTKNDVRELAKEHKLEIWKRPLIHAC